MGIFDKLRSKAGEATEHAKSALGGHHHHAASDAMGDASQKGAEHLPPRAADALGDMPGKARDAGQDAEQAAHDMESEGGHEPQ